MIRIDDYEETVKSGKIYTSYFGNDVLRLKK